METVIDKEALLQENRDLGAEESDQKHKCPSSSGKAAI